MAREGRSARLGRPVGKQAGVGTHETRSVVPPVLDVRVPGVDVVVEMGGEPWRLVSVRTDPPLALLARVG